MNDEQEELQPRKDYELIFPDNVYLSMDVQGYDTWYYTFYWELLPCLGLDTLCSLLQAPRFDNMTSYNIKRLVEDLLDHSFYRAWIEEERFAQDRMLHVSQARFNHWRSWMRSQNETQEYTDTILPKFDIEQQVRQHCQEFMHWKVYRQRAWIFFSGSGRQPDVPTWDYMDAQLQSIIDMVDRDNQGRRRRSQKWQDYWARRTSNPPLDPRSSANWAREYTGPADERESIFSTVPRFFEPPRRGDILNR